MNRIMNGLGKLCLLALLSALAACGSLHKEATSFGSANSGQVIVVGRVELVPRLTQSEQNIRLGTFDPFDVKSIYQGRAIFHLAERPMGREKTNEVINPRLEETFFYEVPKDKRYAVDAGVMLYARPISASKYQHGLDTRELLIPVPLELDIKPTDTAIYIGTIRLHRDEFNEVTKFEVLDHSTAAAVDFKNKFGTNAGFRKALVKTVGRQK